MIAGNILSLRIDDVAFGGEGVGRIGDLVVFVPYTVDGDEVRVELTRVHRRYARGKVVELLRPSPFRTPPPCPYYGLCGGCHLQHIRYDHQLALKGKQVADVFQRIGRVSPLRIRDIVPSPRPFHYRGKAEFHVGVQAGKVPLLGFMRSGSDDLVDIERCEIVDETINEASGALRRSLLALPPGGGPAGRRKVPLWSFPGSPPKDPEREEALPFETVLRTVTDRVFVVPRTGFFQANTELTGRLVQEVLSRCGDGRHDSVLDAYCGSGLFAVFLAPATRRLFGIESDPQAIRCADFNLRHAGFDQAVLFQGDVAEGMERGLASKGVSLDAAVLDPPRPGCGRRVLEALARIRPRRIVYISCNPPTQARDIRYLAETGYVCSDLLPLDMFPQTAHVEVIALLEAKGQK